MSDLVESFEAARRHAGVERRVLGVVDGGAVVAYEWEADVGQEQVRGATVLEVDNGAVISSIDFCARELPGRATG